MVKLTLRTAAILVAFSTSALADTQTWTITEEASTGIKYAQGKWIVNVDADKKISGTATLSMNNGTDLAYTVDGSVKDAVYTVNMSNRTDGKNGCVLTAQAPPAPVSATPSKEVKSYGLLGKAVCEGKAGFTVRAGF